MKDDKKECLVKVLQRQRRVDFASARVGNSIAHLEKTGSMFKVEFVYCYQGKPIMLAVWDANEQVLEICEKRFRSQHEKIIQAIKSCRFEVSVLRNGIRHTAVNSAPGQVVNF